MVLLLWFGSCRWKCSGAVVVLQKRILTNNFKPIFSLVVRSRLSSRACYRPCLDSHTIFHSASKNSHFEQVIIINLLWIHSTAATVFILCYVSVDRFIVIRFPFRYQDIVTKKRCYAVIIIV